MSDFNTLLHGSAAEAAAVLSGDRPPEGAGAIPSLRAALTNALNRIDRLEERLKVPAPVRKTYIVTVKPVDDTWADCDLHELDQDVAGVYRFNGIDEEDALDQFHGSIPIKVLDDFEIICQIEPGIRPPTEDGK